MLDNQKSVSLETEELEVLPQMNYAVISSESFAICENENKLWHCLQGRKNYQCMVYAMVDQFKLQQLLQQKYPSFFYSNNAGLGSIALKVPTPLKGKDGYYSLHNSSQLIEGSIQHPVTNYSLSPTLQNINMGFWSISGLNGYYIANSINELIDVFLSNRLNTPLAIWCYDSYQAHWTVRQEYVRRFYQRYSAEVENILLPSKLTSTYYDPSFEKREERLKYNEGYSQLLYDFYKLGF